MSKTWCFSAVDTWFFKESRPMEAIGSSELASVFPPSSRTLVGAIRSSVGEAQKVDWQAYQDKKTAHELADIIGYGDDLGALHVTGPWLHQDTKRLYPAPLNLMIKDEAIHFLRIGAACHCDLGAAVRLPKLPDAVKGAKPLENCWLTASDYQAVLAGKSPQNPISRDALLVDESRIGIARDNATRIVKEGLLYQTQHVRPMPNVSVCLDVAGLDPQTQSDRLLRLGGEGRMASVQILERPEMPTSPKSTSHTHGMIIYLLTPLACATSEVKEAFAFEGFVQKETDGQTVWQGQLEGIDITLHSAVQGKVIREGGWNMAEHKPRAVESFWPPGSCWYCTVDNGDIDTAIQRLHRSQIGSDTDKQIGRGLIAVGLWQKELLENKQ